MTAIEIACRQCSQQPFELCILEDGSRAPFTHACRIEDAAEMSEPTSNDPEIVMEAIDAAAEEII